MVIDTHTYARGTKRNETNAGNPTFLSTYIWYLFTPLLDTVWLHTYILVAASGRLPTYFNSIRERRESRREEGAFFSSKKENGFFSF